MHVCVVPPALSDAQSNDNAHLQTMPHNGNNLTMMSVLFSTAADSEKTSSPHSAGSHPVPLLQLVPLPPSGPLPLPLPLPSLPVQAA